MKRPPLRIFFCYAHEDMQLRHALDAHLDLLEREGLVAPWFDGRITPGAEWSAAIEQNLRASDIVVFLISPAFLASQYIAEVEMRIALELHRARKACLLPVLVAPVADFASLPLGQLQALPSGALPITQWQDRVRALDDVVHGIRRAAIGVIIDGGGPFEFGPHAFAEAELAELDVAARSRALAGLGRLRQQLVGAVPARRLEHNLLVATWSLNRFGREPLLPESLFYMAQLISAFDVVSLQEVARDMGALRALIAILGPEWGYLISDITEGTPGNAERFAILYYQPRVAFEHIAGEVVLPASMLVEGRQFARKPLLASFRAGAFHFRVCTAHIHFGGGGADARRHRLAECRTLAAFLARIARRDAQNLVLSGNFNIERKDGAAVRAFKAEGFSVPPRIVHPTDLSGTRFYDMTGLLLNDAATGVGATIGRAGALNPFESVFRAQDREVYAEAVAAQRPAVAPPPNAALAYEKFWRPRQLSDHVPLWVELKLGRDARRSLPAGGGPQGRSSAAHEGPRRAED